MFYNNAKWLHGQIMRLLKLIMKVYSVNVTQLYIQLCVWITLNLILFSIWLMYIF